MTRLENDNGPQQLPGTESKLPPIPKGAKIQKRPLNRRQPPASSKSRIIYVSSSTPFMAAVTRARKQLGGSSHGVSKRTSLHSRVQALGSGDGEHTGVVVTVMGTGRAVEKTLAVASWFEQQGDCVVEMKTRTVATVDDVIVEDEDGEDESRVRRMSCLEVAIRSK